MDSLDIFYKAYTKYRELTLTDVEVGRITKVSNAQSSEEHEGMKIIFTSCTINEDWVEAIENGLVFIEKAIREERKFIRSDGDVLPIEKVRKTTVNSIQDLAKHSNYITHEAVSGGPTDIMPDKLLVVTKENDFAVYENKVVYACLLYLKDFVSTRLTKIKNETNKYEGQTFIKKKLDVGNRIIDFDFKLNEKRLNDPYVSKLNTAGAIIARLDKILALIMAFLKTPLMNEVAKADTVSRPITKTNVLRMDRNFRESLNLFDYIAGYEGDGFVLKTTERSLYPFSPELATDTCQITMLSSFLCYVYGNSLTGELKKRFLAIEAEEKRREEEKLLARLSSIHSKANMKGETINDYLIAFEEGYRILERKLEEREQEITALKEEHKAEIEKINRQHDQDIRDIEQVHQEEVNSIETSHKTEIVNITNSYENKLVSLRQETDREIFEAKAECENKIAQINEEKEKAINEIKDASSKEIEDYKLNKDKEVADLKEEINNQMTELTTKCEEEIKTLTEKYEGIIKDLTEKYEAKVSDLSTKLADMTNLKNDFESKYHVSRSLTTSMLLRSGRKEDFPNLVDNRKDFDELEKDYYAFIEYYKFAWAEVKANLRKKIMSGKPLTRKEKKLLENKDQKQDEKKEGGK